MSLISSWQWWFQKKPHSQEGEVTVGLQSNGFLEEVISKVVVDPPATTSLRWSSVYRILQREYTWCRVKFESTLHETELCKDVIKMLLLIAFIGRLFSFQKWWQVLKVWISIETFLYHLPDIFHHGSLFWETARQGCRQIGNVDVEQGVHQIGHLRRHLKGSFLSSLVKQTAINKTM